jgi:hypothetical protein
MAISPYSVARPVNFEYKPMGLEAFAKPLSAMQEQYTKTETELDKLPKMFSSVEADNPRRKEIEASIQKANDELKEQFLKHGNYRQTQREILKLQKKFNEDPEKLLLEQQVANRTAFVKAEKERFLQGKISRNTYETRVARHDEDYAAKGGLNYKSDNEYNTISTRASLDSQEENIQKDITDFMKSSPAQKKEYLGSYKNLDGGYRKELLDRLEEGKSGPELEKEVRSIILSQDRYRDYAAEVTDDSLWIAKKDKNFYETIGKELINYELSQLSSSLEDIDKKDKYLENKQRLEKLQLMTKPGGVVDKEEVDKIYKSLKTQQIFNTKPYADLYSYKDVTYTRSGYNPDKSTIEGYDKDGKWIGEKSFEISTDGNIAIDNYSDVMNKASKISLGWGQTASSLKLNHALVPVGQRVSGDKLGLKGDMDYMKNEKGEFVAANKGKNNWFPVSKERVRIVSEAYNNNVFSNPATSYANLSGVLDAYERAGGKKETFIQNLKNNGIKLSPTAYNDAFNSLGQTGNYALAKQELENLSVASTEYTMAKEVEKDVYKVMKNNPEFQALEMKIKESSKNQSIADNNPNHEWVSGERDSYINERARWRKEQYDIKQNYIRNNTDKLRPIFDVDNNAKQDAKLATLFSTSTDLAGFKPVFATSFKGQPGFDENGNPVQGMTILPKGVRTSYIPSIGKMGFKVPYSYKDPETEKITQGFVYVEPKKGSTSSESSMARQILIDHLQSDKKAISSSAALTLYNDGAYYTKSESDLKTVKPYEKVKAGGKNFNGYSGEIWRNPINGTVGVIEPTYNFTVKNKIGTTEEFKGFANLNSAKEALEKYYQRLRGLE